MFLLRMVWQGEIAGAAAEAKRLRTRLTRQIYPNRSPPRVGGGWFRAVRRRCGRPSLPRTEPSTATGSPS